MKINILLLLAGIIFIGTTNAQEEKKEFTPGGKAHGKVFANYHYDMTKDVNQASAFAINRAYFGYKYSFSEKLSTKITFDVGSVGAGSVYTAYLKVAQLDWKVADPVTLSIGQIGLKQFNDQEKHWGYRYIYKSMQDEHKFGSSADAGVNANIKLNDMLQVNLGIINGEGYKAAQDEFGLHKIYGNVVLKPAKGLTVKAYFDRNPKKIDVFGNDSIINDTTAVYAMNFFVGYKVKDVARVGIEYNMLNNGTKYSNNAADHDLSGFSLYATYIVNKKIEILARFDQLSSNTLSGATDPWNNSKDGSAIIGGVQYTPAKGVKMALNYQGWMYADSDIDQKSLVYLNFEYKF